MFSSGGESSSACIKLLLLLLLLFASHNSLKTQHRAGSRSVPNKYLSKEQRKAERCTLVLRRSKVRCWKVGGLAAAAHAECRVCHGPQRLRLRVQRSAELSMAVNGGGEVTQPRSQYEVRLSQGHSVREVAEWAPSQECWSLEVAIFSAHSYFLLMEATPTGLEPPASRTQAPLSVIILPTRSGVITHILAVQGQRIGWHPKKLVRGGGSTGSCIFPLQEGICGSESYFTIF